jgi:hypothetical protein
MRSLLHPDRVQRYSWRKLSRDALPQEHRERFAGRETASGLEFRERVSDATPVQRGDDLVVQQRIELRQIYYSAALGAELPFDRYAALILMTVLVRGLAEL